MKLKTENIKQADKAKIIQDLLDILDKYIKADEIASLGGKGLFWEPRKTIEEILRTRKLDQFIEF